MTSFLLRLLAFLAMTADNAGLALFPHAELFRAAGRIAFPLYCFLLSEGFVHTHSRKRYACRLLLLSLVCEIPFDLLHFGSPLAPMMQNAGWSLLLSLGMLALCGRTQKPHQHFLILAGACLLAMAANLSFGWLGPALCFAFYSTRGQQNRQAAAAFLLPLAYAFLLMLSGVSGSWTRLSLTAPAAALPIIFYNGRPGPKGKHWTFLFYAAVPAMLILLLLLRQSRVVPPWILQKY